MSKKISKKDSILLIGGGVLGEFGVDKARQMGLVPVVMDGNKDCACFKRDDCFHIHQDFNLHSEICSKVKEFYKKHQELKLCGAFTQGCEAAEAVEYVQTGLNLPITTVNTKAIVNKRVQKRRLIAAKIPVPRLFAYIFNIPHKVVVKPVDNCASRGLSIVDGNDFWDYSVRSALKESRSGWVIVEEFIEGVEYSVDTFWVDGIMYKCGISRRGFLGKNKYAVQSDSITPAGLSSKKMNECYDVMRRAGLEFRIKGPLKGDLIIEKNTGKVYVLEVTPRLSGGFDSQVRKPFCHGLDLIRAGISMAIGKTPDPYDLKIKKNLIAKTFTIFPNPGTIKSIDGVDKAREIKGVANITMTAKVGDKIPEVLVNCAQRVCCATVYGATLSIVARAERQVRETIKFEVVS